MSEIDRHTISFAEFLPLFYFLPVPYAYVHSLSLAPAASCISSCKCHLHSYFISITSFSFYSPFFLLSFLFLSVYCRLLDAAIRGQFGYSGDRAVGKADMGKEEKDVEEEEEGGECLGECRCPNDYIINHGRRKGGREGGKEGEE